MKTKSNTLIKTEWTNETLKQHNVTRKKKNILIVFYLNKTNFLAQIFIYQFNIDF